MINYNSPIEGVVKKQIKINSKTKEEVNNIEEKLKNESIYNNQIISSIDNPENNKVKFKDVRKITIGLSKKDITSHRCKQKSAFYNCFVLIIRLNINGCFYGYYRTMLSKKYNILNNSRYDFWIHFIPCCHQLALCQEYNTVARIEELVYPINTM